MRIHIRIKGHVQGVGYRYFAVQTAKIFSLTGWVRNCSNGDVECEAQGEENDLQNFLEQLTSGHRWAQVNEIEQKKISEKPNEKGFEIKY